jgi:hypothetical protein
MSNDERTYDKALNKFAAMSSEEFRSVYLNLDASKLPKNTVADLSNVEAATSVDWRTKGAVSGVKD